MTISFPISLPSSISADIAQIILVQRNSAAVSESPFTLSQQAYEFPAQRWEMTIELNPMVRAAAERWVAFLTSLRGRYGTFLAGDLSAPTTQGSSTGSPKVMVASQTGYTLQVYGFTNSVNVLKAGDYVQLGGGSTSRLYKVVQDVNTTSGGVCTLDIWPSLRSTPSSGDTLTVGSCQTSFRLSDNAPSWKLVAPGIYDSITFTAVEAL